MIELQQNITAAKLQWSQMKYLKWDNFNKRKGIDLQCENRVCKKTNDHFGWRTCLADHPFPMDNNVHYFEVEVSFIFNGGIYVGASLQSYNPEKRLGDTKESWGIAIEEIEQEQQENKNSSSESEQISNATTIGIVVDRKIGQLQFYRNGKIYGKVIQHADISTGWIYPACSVLFPDSDIVTLIGEVQVQSQSQSLKQKQSQQEEFQGNLTLLKEKEEADKILQVTQKTLQSIQNENQLLRQELTQQQDKIQSEMSNNQIEEIARQKLQNSTILKQKEEADKIIQATHQTLKSIQNENQQLKQELAQQQEKIQSEMSNNQIEKIAQLKLENSTIRKQKEEADKILQATYETLQSFQNENQLLKQAQAANKEQQNKFLELGKQYEMDKKQLNDDLQQEKQKNKLQNSELDQLNNQLSIIQQQQKSIQVVPDTTAIFKLESEIKRLQVENLKLNESAKNIEIVNQSIKYQLQQAFTKQQQDKDDAYKLLQDQQQQQSQKFQYEDFKQSNVLISKNKLGQAVQQKDVNAQIKEPDKYSPQILQLQQKKKLEFMAQVQKTYNSPIINDEEKKSNKVAKISPSLNQIPQMAQQSLIKSKLSDKKQDKVVPTFNEKKTWNSNISKISQDGYKVDQMNLLNKYGSNLKYGALGSTANKQTFLQNTFKK